MGSSDNHFGQPGVRYNSISGIYAEKLDRKEILDAFNSGKCYATTGERIIIDVKANGKDMGSTIYYVRVIQKEPITLPCALEGSGVLQVRPVMAWSTPVWVEN